MFGLNKNKKIHFIGVGGIGMSALAEILLSQGFSVSGSDIGYNENIQKLEKLGLCLYKEHEGSNVEGSQLIVYSSAIRSENLEISKGNELKIPIVQRAALLAEMMRTKYGIAVAGSHGKTTTSSYVASILTALDTSPSYIIGGIVSNLGGHAKLGDSEVIVAEADESDGSFLKLNPIMSVITNIDDDHLDYYGSMDRLKDSFCEFANKVPFYGVVALNINDKNSKEILSKISSPYITFGVDNNLCESDHVDYIAKNIETSENGSHFKVVFNGKEHDVKIDQAGKHNVLNALGAMAVVHRLGYNLGHICNAVKSFTGVKRRFESLYNSKMKVVDDYAHHPTEINVTIETAKKKFKDTKVITVFEPHRYTRTLKFWNEFIDCFGNVDKAFIAPVYAASEMPIENCESEDLVKKINEKFGNASKLNSWNEMKSLFNEYEDEASVILCLGAGSISKNVREQLAQWRS